MNNAIVDIYLVAFNVCGLRSKLKSTYFDEFIHKFKLICLTDAKLHSLDDLNIPNNSLILKNRKGAKRFSGGVAILVHESIDKYASRINIPRIYTRTLKKLQENVLCQKSIVYDQG